MKKFIKLAELLVRLFGLQNLKIKKKVGSMNTAFIRFMEKSKQSNEFQNQSRSRYYELT